MIFFGHFVHIPDIVAPIIVATLPPITRYLICTTECAANDRQLRELYIPCLVGDLALLRFHEPPRYPACGEPDRAYSPGPYDICRIVYLQHRTRLNPTNPHKASVGAQTRTAPWWCVRAPRRLTRYATVP